MTSMGAAQQQDALVMGGTSREPSDRPLCGQDRLFAHASSSCRCVAIFQQKNGGASLLTRASLPVETLIPTFDRNVETTLEDRETGW